MELNRDIISNISKYLNDYEIIYLSSTCKQYYDMCNNYLIFQRLFDDLPFGINNCVCDKVNKSLVSYGYCKLKRIHDKNSFISDNMCIYPLLFGFSIIPILLNMKSGIIKCKFPNYNDNKIIHACVVMNHILMSPSNKIYNSIMMNKTFDRPC